MICSHSQNHRDSKSISPGRRFGCLVFVLITGILGPAAQSGEGESSAPWYQFRGPGGDGVSLETGLQRTWPEEGPDVVWRRSIGSGYSGLAIVDEAFYTLFAENGVEFLGRFTTDDGGEVWRLQLGAVFKDEFGAGPRATPTVIDEIVYALGGQGLLAAVAAMTGKLLWHVDLYAEALGIHDPQWAPEGATLKGLQLPNWGYSYSPLVEGDLIVVDTGHGDGKSIVAFDRWTGEMRWSALSTPIGYASPAAVTLGGQRQILVFTVTEIVSLLPSGEIYWRRPWALTLSQPIFLPPDKIFVSTVRHTVGASVFRVDTSSGRPEIETVWESQVMRNFWNSSVAYEGHLYGFDNATFKCISATTGELLWARRGLGKGSLIAADGLLVLMSDQGLLTLVEASPEAYREKGQVRIFETARTWTPPALAAGKLFLRGGEEIVVLDLVDGTPEIALAEQTPIPADFDAPASP